MYSKTDTFDLMIFAGQSNMAGRGDLVNAAKCNKNAGFEYKTISNPNALIKISEPFGLDEDSRRLVVRGDIKQWNQLLAETARNSGVITNGIT